MGAAPLPLGKSGRVPVGVGEVVPCGQGVGAVAAENRFAVGGKCLADADGLGGVLTQVVEARKRPSA